MPKHVRYAIYLVPEEGPLARFGAQFLGWDVLTGTNVPQSETLALPRPLSELTATPAKYGFHGTIKPPMRLARGRNLAGLKAACHALLAEETPISIGKLRLARLGSFLALVPSRDAGAFAALAGRLVTGLDPFRAPLTPEDRARRKPDSLSENQLRLLDRWGYPYVLEEFRFHMTLTGRLTHADAVKVEAALAPILASLLAEPLTVTSLCICGERLDGRFELVERIPLGA
ncbi:MAG: DUF1045 domain-containing protein [Dinoroseobacter sp.]|nr:DUF1045 domain-containing protein [Dinoroseobacter sp.]